MPTIKKLIEVALPLEAINAESAREKSIRHGHPSTLHLWWARRPLATARAVIWSSLVDDPSSHPEQFPTEEAQQQERERLFGILTRLVKWENSNDEGILARSVAESPTFFTRNPNARTTRLIVEMPTFSPNCVRSSSKPIVEFFVMHSAIRALSALLSRAFRPRRHVCRSTLPVFRFRSSKW